MDQSVFSTPWGWMGLAITSRGVRMIVLPKTSRQAVENSFASQKHSSTIPADFPTTDQLSSSLMTGAQAQISSYIAGRQRTLNIPIDVTGGSSFQRQVWRAIAAIPYGRVRSYKSVATRVGGSQFARAVGHALGANPVPLIIPCHRIVAHNGLLGGYSDGLSMKRRLLALEGSLAQLASR